MEDRAREGAAPESVVSGARVSAPPTPTSLMICTRTLAKTGMGAGADQMSRAFLDPKKPGRTYEPVAGDDHFPVFGVPWYGDLRVKEERVEGYGDAGIVHAPDFILQDNWDMHPQAVTSDWTIKVGFIPFSQSSDFSLSYYTRPIFACPSHQNVLSASLQPAESLGDYSLQASTISLRIRQPSRSTVVGR